MSSSLPRSAACWAIERSARLEARLLEHVRVQLEHGLAQLRNRVDDRIVRPRDGRMGRLAAHVLELVAREEQVLDRMVVQRLRERPSLALLGLKRVGQQAGASVCQASDLLGSLGEQRGEQHARHADPGEEAGLGRDETDRVRLVRRRMGECLDDVCDGRNEHGCGSNGRPERGTRP